MKLINAKKIVLNSYPESYCATGSTYYVIWSRPVSYSWIDFLGRGLTEKEAWETALKRIEKEMIKKLES